MVPLYITTKDKEFGHEDFVDYLTDLCRQHKEQGRALAFAFLAYDFEDNTITQMLKNKDYWATLDKISGKYLSIFYLNTRDDYFKKRQRQIYNEEKRKRNSNSSKGYISFLVPLTMKPTPIDVVNNHLKEEFNIESQVDTPFVVFFQTDGEEIIDYFVVQLKKEKLEESFLELKKHIELATNSLSKITKNNFQNHQEIFNQVKLSIEGGQFYEFVKTKIVPRIKIGTLLSVFKLLAG